MLINRLFSGLLLGQVLNLQTQIFVFLVFSVFIIQLVVGTPVFGHNILCHGCCTIGNEGFAPFYIEINLDVRATFKVLPERLLYHSWVAHPTAQHELVDLVHFKVSVAHAGIDLIDKLFEHIFHDKLKFLASHCQLTFDYVWNSDCGMLLLIELNFCFLASFCNLQSILPLILEIKTELLTKVLIEFFINVVTPKFVWVTRHHHINYSIAC